MPKTRREVAREVDEILSQRRPGKGSTPSSETRFHLRLPVGDADIEQMFKNRGATSDSAKVAILGDPMYVRRFKMPKWNTRPSVLDTADVAIRHYNELGIPVSKHAHQLRADYFRELRDRFQAEHHQMLSQAERAYPNGGALLSGGLREDWPRPVKDRIRFIAQGIGILSDAIRLHETLRKTRASAFH